MNQLNPFAISGLLIAISYLPLFVLTLFRGKSKLTLIFSFHAFVVFLWGLGSFIIGINKNPDYSLILWKSAYAAALLIPVSFQHAIMIMLGKNFKAYLVLIYGQAMFFIYCIFTNQLIHSTEIVFNSFYYMRQGLPAFMWSFIFWVIIILVAHTQLILYYQKLQARQKREAVIFFIGIIGFIGGISNFFPMLEIDIYPFGNFLIPICSLSFMYAIIRFQFLEISIILKRSIVYSIVLTLISSFYLIVVFIGENLMRQYFAYQSFMISALTAFVIGLVFAPLRNQVQKIVDHLFFKGTALEIAEKNELLLQEVALKEKYKATATFASGIAHEVKNPLTALKTFIEFYPQKKDDPEFIAKFTKLAGHEINRIDDLVRNLLDFAKPLPLEISTCNVHNIIQSTLHLLEGDIKKHNLNIQRDFNANPSLIHADSNQIKQALINIIMNAIEATNDSGKITITTQTQDNFIEIKITDTGCGMNKDELSHLFEPFYTNKDNGTGLGLPITYGIIEKHKGKINVESEKDQGTTFIIKLPGGGDA